MDTYSGQTDETTEVTLPSAIEVVMWTRAVAAPGATVGLSVFTRFVGNGSDMQIELSDAEGRKHGTFKDKLNGNRFTSQLVVPPKAAKALVAEVKLPKHGLSMTSPALLLAPVVEITNARWSEQTARRGDLLTLEADVTGAADGTEAEILVWEHDEEGAHEPVTKFPVLVQGGKVEAEWEFEYVGDVADVPTDEEAEGGYQAPEFVFRVQVQGIQAESNRLAFIDTLNVSIVDAESGAPYADQKVTAHLADGSTRDGSLDAEGHLLDEDVPPGPVRLELPNIEVDEERMEDGTPAAVPPVEDVVDVEVDPAKPVLITVRSGSSTLVRLHMKSFELSL